MLKNNILASNVVYTSISHKKHILNDTFKKIKKCENEQENIFNLLETPESIIGLREKNKNV